MQTMKRPFRKLSHEEFRELVADAEVYAEVMGLDTMTLDDVRDYLAESAYVGDFFTSFEERDVRCLYDCLTPRH